MASMVYNRMLQHRARGDLDFSADVFKVMLTTASYAEDKDAHEFRSDVTDEVSGPGYTAGGNTVSVSIALDTGNDRMVITLGGTDWPASSFTARKAVYYKSRGGPAADDELIAVIDNGADLTSAGGTFVLTASTITDDNA